MGWDAQQQTVIIPFKPEKIQTTGICQQCPVIIIGIIVKLIVGCIKSADAFEQLHFRTGTMLFENPDGFFGCTFVSFNGHGSIDDVLHPLAYSFHVFLFYGTPNA